jgi:AraC-like DNA-binding protein
MAGSRPRVRAVAGGYMMGDVTGSSAIKTGGRREWYRILHDPRLPGVEVLQAHYREYRYAPHWHEAVCVAVVGVGAAAFDCGQDSYFAPAGSVFVIPAFEVHTGEPAAEAGLGYSVAYLSPGRLADLLEGAGSPGRSGLVPPSRRDVVRHRTAAAGPLLRFHQTMAGPASLLQREHALLDAAVAVAGEFGPAHRSHAVPPEHRAVRRAREYLHAHPAAEVTLRELATVSGLSMYRLARTFKVETGLAPHAYQVQLRVLRAKRLLAGGWPIAAAAVECGFYDQAHLTAQFKRHTGVTPGAYIRGAVGRTGR